MEESRDDENILDFDTCTNFNRLVAKERAKEAKGDIAPGPTNPNVTPKLEVIYPF